MTRIPRDWRRLHSCARMGARPGEHCLFCRLHDEHPDLEAIPYDVPGVYDLSGEPVVVVRATTRGRARTRRSRRRAP